MSDVRKLIRGISIGSRLDLSVDLDIESEDIDNNEWKCTNLTLEEAECIRDELFIVCARLRMKMEARTDKDITDGGR